MRADGGNGAIDAEWNVVTFEEARRRRFIAALNATIEQRLAWLESAIRLAHCAGALPRPRTGSGRVIDVP